METLTNRITAVCISRNPESWPIPTLSFHCYTEGWKRFGHEKSRARVAYLAERRNKAVAQALSLLPETEHILMVDSYYLRQEEQIRKLVREYQELIRTSEMRNCILGASTWIYDKTRLRSRTHFFDGWTTPEGLAIRLDEARMKGGLVKVKAVGGCYLYPRQAWEQVGYGVPQNLHGCEHNWLCEKSALPVRLSLNVMLWREPVVYPWPKRVRMSLHVGRLRPKQERDRYTSLARNQLSDWDH